jgi:hypothetical protein
MLQYIHIDLLIDYFACENLIIFITHIVVFSFVAIEIDNLVSEFFLVVGVIFAQFFEFFVCDVWSFWLINLHFGTPGFVVFCDLVLVPSNVGFDLVLLVSIQNTFYFFWLLIFFVNHLIIRLFHLYLFIF